jgi:hypothetical protein
MCAATIAVELVLTRSLQLGDTVTLGVCLITGGFVYIGAIILFDRSILREGRAVLARGL